MIQQLLKRAGLVAGVLFAVGAAQAVSAKELTDKSLATAVFAGGCFWCVEAAYQDLDGVHDAVSGFTGGTLKNPTYSGNHKGHWEAVKVTYNPDTISYQRLLEIFWHNIDPFDAVGQFCDKGPSYRSAIFVANDEERALAEQSKQKVSDQFPKLRVETLIRPANAFYPVVEGHQDYYKKNPIRYRFYRAGCGRDNRLKEIWGKSAGH
ncbi:MAG: peptide-methionine (S)-S-oxide reductase MsrA [Pseudomonadales bacterium]